MKKPLLQCYLLRQPGKKERNGELHSIAEHTYLHTNIHTYMAMIFFSIAQTLSFRVAWIVVWIERVIRTLDVLKVWIGLFQLKSFRSKPSRICLESMDRAFSIEKLSIHTIQTYKQHEWHAENGHRGLDRVWIGHGSCEGNDRGRIGMSTQVVLHGHL